MATEIRKLSVGDVIQIKRQGPIVTIRIDKITITSMGRLTDGNATTTLDILYIRQKNVDGEMEVQADTIMVGDLCRWLREYDWRKLEGEERGKYLTP